MNEVLTPRIYREYCWFARVLLMLAIALVSRAPLLEARARANPTSVLSQQTP